jgi:hypothetical protein
MFRGINVVSIEVPDPTAAKAFYGEVLGFGAPVYVIFCSFYDPFGNRLQMCSPAP